MVRSMRGGGAMGAQASMDLLKATLAERQAKSQQMLSEHGNGKSWIRRGDIERQREEQYLEELRQEKEKQRAAEEARLAEEEERLAKKRKGKDMEQKKPVEIDMTLLDDDDAEPPIGAEEVCEQLREMLQPITLFGETDMQRYKRLRLLQKEGLEGRTNPDLLMLEQLHNAKAVALEDDAEEFAERRARKQEQEEAKEDAELDAEEAQDESLDSSEKETPGVDSEDEENGEQPAGDKPAEEGASLDKKKEDMKVEVEVALMDRCDFIRTWLRKAVKAWEKELAERSEEDKAKAPHKTQMAQHRQCRRDLKPLQKRLRVYSLQSFYLDKIHTIVKFADEREYRQASEAFFDLTIGKAAWPVGLGCGGSMLMEDAIGLHDKFNRMDQVNDNADAFNDEVARKYGQAVKRLMAVAQRYWPPDDPSKNFGA